MVDKWKRFASEMGRYWMEFIPIQLALCHQVCPTENRYYIQQEQLRYNFSCFHKMVTQDDSNCPVLVNAKKKTRPNRTYSYWICWCGGQFGAWVEKLES